MPIDPDTVVQVSQNAAAIAQQTERISDAVLLAAIQGTVVIITSILGVVISVMNNRKLIKVQKEVTTINGKTLAQLGDAQETARILAKDNIDRTEAEKKHVLVVEAEAAGIVCQTARDSEVKSEEIKKK